MSDEDKTISRRPPDFLVCGEAPVLNSREAQCCRCQGKIWVTAGSLELAMRQKIALICLTCYSKVPVSYFAGFMHHGTMLDPVTSEKMLVEVLQRLAADAEGNRRAQPPFSPQAPGAKS
jgi:hypothetical protein